MSKAACSMTLSLLLVSCVAAPPAQHVRFADVVDRGFRVDWTRPIVLEFQPGDRLPVHLALSDRLFDLSPGAPQLELVAKRRGFVRIEPGRVSTSLTGDDFHTEPLAPGSFNFGISITRQGTWLALAVTTPRHAAPAPEAKP